MRGQVSSADGEGEKEGAALHSRSWGMEIFKNLNSVYLPCYYELIPQAYKILMAFLFNSRVLSSWWFLFPWLF